MKELNEKKLEKSGIIFEGTARNENRRIDFFQNFMVFQHFNCFRNKKVIAHLVIIDTLAVKCLIGKFNKSAVKNGRLNQLYQ